MSDEGATMPGECVGEVVLLRQKVALLKAYIAQMNADTAATIHSLRVALVTEMVKEKP